MNQVEELLGILTHQVILPILIDLDREADQPILTKISAMFSDVYASDSIFTRAGESTDGATGEIRLLLRERSVGCFSFSGEAIFSGLAPATGFSGFSISGKIDEKKAKLSSRSNRYNVWIWGKGFSSWAAT